MNKKTLMPLALVLVLSLGVFVSASEQEMYNLGYARTANCGNNICEKIYFEVLFGETEKIIINNQEISFYLDNDQAFHVNEITDRPNGAMYEIRDKMKSKYGFSTRDVSYLYRNPEAQNYEDRQPYGDYVTIYEEDYCPTDCMEGLSSIRVEKGWNLLNRNLLTDLRLKNLNQGFSYESNFQYVFEYIPYINSYLQSKPRNTKDEKKMEDFFGTLSQDKQQRIGANAQKVGSVWVYSSYAGELLFNTNVLSESISNGFSDIPLISGWNFLSITPEIVGKTFSDIKGNCNAEKLYVFVSETNNWQNIDINNGLFGSLDTGKGFIVKVNSDCELGSSGSNQQVNPPQIPN